MNILINFFIFFFGASIGSFLNVLIDRLIKEETILGRSRCDYCKKKIHWYDLIPIFSFFILRGRSRCCNKKITWQYPMVEFFTGLIFLLIYSQFNYSIILLIIYWGLISSLIVIFVSDFKYKLISDYILWSFGIFSFFYRLIKFSSLEEFLNYLASGLLVALPIFLVFFFSKERAMGSGDVYLAGIIGFLLGWKSGFLALYIAFVFGGIIGLILVLLRSLKFKSKIAFGPFLVIGTAIMLFYEEKIFFIIKKIYGI